MLSFFFLPLPFTGRFITLFPFFFLVRDYVWMYVTVCMCYGSAVTVLSRLHPPPPFRVVSLFLGSLQFSQDTDQKLFMFFLFFFFPLLCHPLLVSLLLFRPGDFAVLHPMTLLYLIWMIRLFFFSFVWLCAIFVCVCIFLPQHFVFFVFFLVLLYFDW